MTVKKSATPKNTVTRTKTGSKTKSITIPIPSFDLKTVAIWLILGFLAFNYAKTELPKYFGSRTAIEKKAASEVADIPFPERCNVADAFRLAADRIGSGAGIQDADEYLRKIIAVQPNAARWSSIVGNLSPSIQDTSPVKYAANLRLAAKGFEQ